MKSTALGAFVTGVVMLGAASICPAQNEPAAPRITVTAGQGGYIVLPDTRPEPERYALTGEVARTRQSSRLWQQTVGPVMNVGQAQLSLPAPR